MKKMKQAFSLVELSIVLVVLGLLTGGILTGQNLIRASELRAVATEFQSFQSAVNTFRSKYFAIPGDMTNATDFWGAEASCPLAAVGTVPKTVTCNGEGDGRLGYWGENPGFGTINQEEFRFWQHLANAGLIGGSYPGTPVSGVAHRQESTVGVNIPASKAGNVGWYAGHIQNQSISHTLGMLDGVYKNVLIIGAPNYGGHEGVYMPSGFLTSEEAWSIDKKMDDAKPGTGRVRTHWRDAVGGSCLSGVSHGAVVSATIEYDLASTSARCVLVFPRAF